MASASGWHDNTLLRAEGGVGPLHRNHMLTLRHTSRLRNAAIGALIVVCGLTSTSSAAAQERQKAVLVLQSIRQEAPSAIAWDSAIRRVLTAGLNGRLDYYAEYFDVARIPDPQFPSAFADYLGRKYAGRTFDVVIAVGPRILEFLNHAGSTLFGGVPVIYYATEPQPKPMTTGVVSRLDLKRTIDVALQVHPDLQQVFVVSGASAFDTFYREVAQTQLRALDGRLAFTYLSGLSMSALLQRAGDIPQRAVLYYLTVQEDADGNKFDGPDALNEIAAVANRPIYTWVDVHMGRGAMGGSIQSNDVLGRALANVALRVLKGESPDRIPVQQTDPNVTAFDWRELRRFGVDEARLPAGSIIQFRQPSVWDQFKWYILGATTLLVLQSALIGGLVVQGARRRRAEVAVRESASALRQSYEQNQDLAGRLINAQEEERARIARDLHDDLSQQLASVSIMLSDLKRKVAKPGSALEVEQTIRTLQGRAATAAEAVRTLSHELHPGVLEHAGLVPALSRHCDEVAAHHHVKVSFHWEGEGLKDLKPDVALCLFRVTQEALTNTVRHARAGEIRVELIWTPGTTNLRIIDDGIGFVPGERAGRGLGLRSIDERVRLSLGAVRLESQIGKGTTLWVRIPRPTPGAP